MRTQVLVALSLAVVAGVVFFLVPWNSTPGQRGNAGAGVPSAGEVEQASLQAGVRDDELRNAPNSAQAAPERRTSVLLPAPDPSSELHERADVQPKELASPKPFDDFFDSEKSYEPKKQDGPVTIGYFQDGTMHFRAEQTLFGKHWKRDGQWNVWHANGGTHEEGSYSNGLEHGPWRWSFPNGNLMSLGSFNVGQREGAWTFYHESGRVSAHGLYARGVGIGHWVHFDENGVKRSEGDFVDGQPDGHWVSYDEQGQLDPTRSGRYERGFIRGN